MKQQYPKKSKRMIRNRDEGLVLVRESAKMAKIPDILR